MLVSDILRVKGADVVTVDPSMTVGDLVALLAERRIGAVVVSPDGESLAGIVSERDVVSELAAHGPGVLGRTVQEICTSEVITAGTDDRLEELAITMTQGRFRHLPVVVDGRLHGIISIGDVVKARLSELEDERQALTNYITGQA
jgi:CBS domain-containing protein